MKSLVIAFSYHHMNTEKIAHAIARVLGAAVKMPQQVRPEEPGEYDLIGFGSGIYGATFDPSSTFPDACRRPRGKKHSSSRPTGIRPNAEDLKNAEAFACRMMEKAGEM